MTSKFCIQCFHCHGRWPTNYDNAPMRRCVHPNNVIAINDQRDLVTGETIYVLHTLDCYTTRTDETKCGVEGKWYHHNYGVDPTTTVLKQQTEIKVKLLNLRGITADDL